MVMDEEELVRKPGCIKEKGAQRFELEHKRCDHIQEDKEEHAGKCRGLHRKKHRKRKQEEKQRQSEGEESDPFSFLQDVAASEI